MSSKRVLWPRESLSRTLTLFPSLTNRRTIADPMKPVPPVTRYFFRDVKLVFHLRKYFIVTTFRPAENSKYQLHVCP